MLAGLEIPVWVPTGEKINIEEGEEEKASEGDEGKEEESMDMEGASTELSKLLDQVGDRASFRNKEKTHPSGAL